MYFIYRCRCPDEIDNKCLPKINTKVTCNFKEIYTFIFAFFIQYKGEVFRFVRYSMVNISNLHIASM